MDGLIQILVPVALVGCGMAAGGLVISVRGAPLLLSLPDQQYVPIHQFLVTRFDPFMPICLLTALFADLVLAFAVDGAGARVLCGTAAALLLSAATVSLTRNVPINRWVSTLDPQALPANFRQLDRRQRWVRWNVVRMGLTVAALAVNAAALGLLL